VVYNERIIHPFQPYDVEATANQLDYWERAFELRSGLSSRNQVWYWKELLGSSRSRRPSRPWYRWRNFC